MYSTDRPSKQKKGRVNSAEGLLQAEEARARVFELEQENASLRRVVEVDLPAEIDALKHQVNGSCTVEKSCAGLCRFTLWRRESVVVFVQ